MAEALNFCLMFTVANGRPSQLLLSTCGSLQQLATRQLLGARKCSLSCRIDHVHATLTSGSLNSITICAEDVVSVVVYLTDEIRIFSGVHSP